MTPKKLAKLLRENPNTEIVLEKYSKSSEQWAKDTLEEFKGDPLFEAEGRIFELEECLAKGVSLLNDPLIPSARAWIDEAQELLQKGE